MSTQDRLIHVIHATSDPFYLHCSSGSLQTAGLGTPLTMTFTDSTGLRQLNIMQHCKIMSVGDASREEANRYFDKHLLPEIPEKLRSDIKFEDLYPVFGGKLAHISDYVADFVNTDGKLSREQADFIPHTYSSSPLPLCSYAVLALCTSTRLAQSTANTRNSIAVGT